MVLSLLHPVLAEHSAISKQILRFGVVGTIGFLIDTAVVYASRGSLGLYGAGLLAFAVAATCNWALNRTWTFRGRGGRSNPRAQLLRYLAVNLIGFTLNRGAYAAVVTFSALAASQPVLGTAAGALAGMSVNFILARQLVFR